VPTLLALSPHLDDAAFSCGGALAQLGRGGWRVVLATVFTRSVPDPTGFALACQLDKGLGPEVDYMALRREEDGRAAEALGCWPPVWLDLPEAPHRGYGSAAALFGPTLPEDDAALLAPLAAALARLAAETSPDLLLAPQAIGGHVDHVQVIRALGRAALDLPVLWWRDFPYTAREAAPAEPFADRMARLPELSIALGERDRGAKARACAAYASQLGFQFGGPAGLDRRLAEAGPVERFRAEGRLPAALGSMLAAEPTT